MRDIPFQQSICHASADFAHRRMTHRSLGVGEYGFGGPRACPWGSMEDASLQWVLRFIAFCPFILIQILKATRERITPTESAKKSLIVHAL
jgi:hypothetical protein